MRIWIACLVLVTLSACTTIPVSRNFPDVPPSLNKRCPVLLETPQTKQLSKVLEVVTENYSLYHECQIKVDLWIEWYQQQRDIFNSVK
jgi:hypothetical protein